MRKVFATAFVSLGLLTFTSCSNDDTDTTGSSRFGEGDLIVTVEEPQEETAVGTRSYLSRDMQTRLYVTLDEMRVYDNALHKYDIYKFNWNDESHKAGVFTRSNKNSFITEAKWALYQKSDVSGGHWDLDEETADTKTFASMYVAANKAGDLVPIIYDGIYQESGTGEKIVVFKDFLPRWGEVSKINGREALETHLSYLTGILRLQLAGMAGHADHLKVQMLEGGTTPLNIAGEFKTTLAINDVKQVDASLAIDTYVDNSGGDHIIIDLSQPSADLEGDDRTKAVVYVPLVTTPGKTVDIVVSASNDGGTTYTEFKRFKNKTIQRGKVYGNSVEYDFTE